MKLLLQYRFLFSLILLSGIFSCRQVDVFEKNNSIPGYKWERGKPSAGSFQIADTLSAYNIYIVVRHTDSYNYNNIWLNVGLQLPGDTMSFQKVDLTLGSDEGWEGTGMNDIWEVRKVLNARPMRFVRAGEYRFDIRHIMRESPLSGIMSVGLRVEKSVRVTEQPPK